MLALTEYMMQPLMINIIDFNAENTGWPQSILQWSILDLCSLVTLGISLCSICKLGMFYKQHEELAAGLQRHLAILIVRINLLQTMQEFILVELKRSES